MCVIESSQKSELTGQSTPLHSRRLGKRLTKLADLCVILCFCFLRRQPHRRINMLNPRLNTPQLFIRVSILSANAHDSWQSIAKRQCTTYAKCIDIPPRDSYLKGRNCHSWNLYTHPASRRVPAFTPRTPEIRSIDQPRRRSNKTRDAGVIGYTRNAKQNSFPAGPTRRRRAYIYPRVHKLWQTICRHATSRHNCASSSIISRGSRGWPRGDEGGKKKEKK